MTHCNECNLRHWGTQHVGCACLGACIDRLLSRSSVLIECWPLANVDIPLVQGDLQRKSTEKNGDWANTKNASSHICLPGHCRGDSPQGLEMKK